MKIAKSYTHRSVHANFNTIKISKQAIKFTLCMIFILISIIPLKCFSITHSSKIEILKKHQVNFHDLDSLDVKKVRSTVNLKVERDTDNDGIADLIDLDDDNDGILDHHEGFQNLYALILDGKGLIITMNGAWVLVPTSVYFELPSNLSHGDEFWIPFMGSQYVKAVRIKFENTESGIKFTQTAAKHTIGNDPDLDINLNYDFENGGIDAPVANADTDEGYGIATIEYKDKVILENYLSESGKIWLSPELDTDNDGLIDSRDTDSDNDGCPDATEANGNITTIATLNNGSNGGSLANLGLSVNKNGIPLPFGTLNGSEIIGQSNSNASIVSEQLVISPFTNISVKTGDNVNILTDASATKTATFNLGVPNFSDVYGTDTSESIAYKWYREDDLNTIISTSKTLIINNVTTNNSGNYIVEVKGSGNTCSVQEFVSLTVDDVLGGIETFKNLQNNFTTYPNPTSGNINVLISSKQDAYVDIVLIDITGKKIQSLSKKITIGKNEISFKVEVESGLLFLKVLSNKVNYGTTKIVVK